MNVAAGTVSQSRMIQWVLWLATLVAVTAVQIPFRDKLDSGHIALLYLLVVLGASARGGRRIGMSVAVLGFLLFNFFFVPPYYTLVVSRLEDWLVLIVFLITSATAAQLLARSQGEATEARSRALEIDRLSALGAEALNVARPEDALAGIANVIRLTLGIARTEIYLQGETGELTSIAEAGVRDNGSRESDYLGGDELRRWVASSGRPVIERADAVARPVEFSGAGLFAALDGATARGIILPLRVQGRPVGVLRVSHDRELRLDEAQQRFVMTLAYYAALGLERVRLAGESVRVAALREADLMKDALLASVSHDLRTPLTTIKALAHDIRMEGDDRAAVIEEEADRLNRFVADLLDLSRLAAGAVPVKAELYAVDDLIGAALQRVNAAEGRVHAEIDDPLLVGRFDFTQALRALVNLLENALKYSPSAIPVDVSVKRHGDMLQISVADRGPGVSEQDQPQLFQPFCRPSELQNRGVGLGLSIASGLAKAQGGAIEYESRPGGGSLFLLRLPAGPVHQSL